MQPVLVVSDRLIFS